MSLCQYKDALGKPNEGFRKYRIFDIAVVDTLLAIVLGLLLSKLLNTSKFNGILISFLLSIIFHRIFCVDTTINKKLSNLLS